MAVEILSGIPYGSAILSVASGPLTQTYVGLTAGLFLLFVAVGAVLWYEAWRRKSLQERPPQRCKLLRPPGFSLSERLERLNERSMWPMAQVAISGGFAGIIGSSAWPLIGFLWSNPDDVGELLHGRGPAATSALILGMLAAGLIALHGVLRLHKLFHDIRSCQLGLRGEQAVGEALTSRKVSSAGYVVFHDIPTDGPGNVDHVAIGPGGVFVIETKTRSKRKATRDQAATEVRFDGRTLHFPWGDDNKAAQQVELNAAWVRGFIGEFADKNILIQPLLVLPGWYVVSLGNYTVKAMNAKYLSGYLAGAARQYTVEQLEPIISRFDERCRTVEF